MESAAAVDADDPIETSPPTETVKEAPDNAPPIWRIWSVAPTKGHDDVPDIEFNVLRDAVPSAESLAYVAKAEATLTAIRTIYPITSDRYKQRHNEIHRRIYRASQLGLVRKEPALEAANAALDHIRDQILALEGGRIKNHYMVRLGAWAAILAVTGILGSLIMPSLVPFASSAYPSGTTSFINAGMLCIAWAGSMLGAWASFAIRKPDFHFEDLTLIEKDRVDPALRLIFCGLLTIILCLLFTSGSADVSIGNFKASDMTHSDTSAWLVGLLCGISEMALPTLVSQRASSFINHNPSS